MTPTRHPLRPTPRRPEAIRLSEDGLTGNPGQGTGPDGGRTATYIRASRNSAQVPHGIA